MPGRSALLTDHIASLSRCRIPGNSLQDLLDLGVYLTTAVKCSKASYTIQSYTIRECSRLLEAELNLFPDLKAYLLMGDVAIKAVNTIAQRAGQERVIPAESTYKLRGGEYFFRGKRAFHLTCKQAELLHREEQASHDSRRHRQCIKVCHMNTRMSPKRRFLTAMLGGMPDRIPVGNVVSVVTASLMEQAGAWFPDAHLEADSMARLAAAGHTLLDMTRSCRSSASSRRRQPWAARSIGAARDDARRPHAPVCSA